MKYLQKGNIVSFDKMTAKQLREVAAMFGVDVAGLNKATILKTLADDGVTYDAYEAFTNAEKVSPKDEGYAVAEPSPTMGTDLVLLKMVRDNPSYEIFYKNNRYTFTARHPYVAVPEDAADFIFDTEEGFQIATPKEVRNFYG